MGNWRYKRWGLFSLRFRKLASFKKLGKTERHVYKAEDSLRYLYNDQLFGGNRRNRLACLNRTRLKVTGWVNSY